MLKHIIDFYKVSAPAPCNGDFLPEQKQRLKRLQWSTFLAATLGYSMYYVCRLSLNVVKKPIVDEGIFSETELGIIGSVLFFTYAILQRFPCGQEQHQPVYVNRFVGDGIDKPLPGFYKLIHTVCHLMGYQRLVSIYGSGILCSRAIALVYG